MMPIEALAKALNVPEEQIYGPCSDGSYTVDPDPKQGLAGCVNDDYELFDDEEPIESINYGVYIGTCGGWHIFRG